MRQLLALDLATTTGWAFGSVERGGRPRLANTIRFTGKGACDEDVWFEALKWLIDQMNVLGPDVVAIEAPIMSASTHGGSNTKTLMRLIGLQAVLRTVVRAKKPNLARLIHVQSARKFFIGHGNLPGAQAKLRIKERCIQLGWADADTGFDTTDAMCVWAKAAGELDPAFAASFTELGMAGAA